MIKNDNTPVRFRTVLEAAYADAGQPDFQFCIPQPFTAEHVSGVAEIGASPQGVANQINQVLAENLCNNIAARIRNAIKSGTALPTQDDMDTLYLTYDFSGLRQPSGSSAVSLFDRIFTRMAGQFIKRLLKRKGYQHMAAPVTVAKKDETPAEGQISFEAFENEVYQLVSGEGPWGEIQAFIDVREDLIESSKNEEAAVRARELAAESKFANLGL